MVIGGGPNGVELAQVFARFGTAVTLLESEDRIDERARSPRRAEVLAEVFAEEGIEVRTGVEVSRVEHDGEFTCGSATSSVPATSCWWRRAGATTSPTSGWRRSGSTRRRTPSTPTSGMRAGERLWAVGDITGKGAFTHVSRYQAAVAVRDILGDDGPPADYRGLSRVTFTDPEIASVGLSESAGPRAGDRGAGRPRRHRASPAAGWMHGRGNAGLVKLVADAERGVLVGGTVVAPYGGEVVGLVAAAVHAEIPVATLRGMHFAYPTFHRAIEAALADLG